MGAMAATSVSVSEPRARRLHAVGWLLLTWIYAVALIGLLLPLLSLLKSQGLLQAEWLNAWGSAILPWASILMLVLILLRKRVYRWCFQLAEWLCASEAPAYRWVVVGISLLIFTSYTLQVHIGVAHRGVPGWVYRSLADVIRTEPPADLQFSPGYDAEAFSAALRPEVLPSIARSGFASSDVLYLHFRDGSMRPANNQLLLVSWPKATFGIVDGEVSHPEEFLAVIRHNFAHRRAGRQMILPDAIAYPSHLNYQHIDYREYPPVEDLVGASIWTVTSRVNPSQNTAEIVGARMIAKVVSR